MIRAAVSRTRFVAALALLTLSCSSLGVPTASSAEQHPLLGATAPPFDLPMADQKRTLALASYAGKVVIVDFWATWCQPCHESFPAFQRISKKYAGKVVVLGISVDEEPGGIPKFARETGATFPLAWDDGQVVSRSYQPPTMPTCYVVDQSGIVRFVHSGFHAGEEPELERELSSLLH